LGARGPAAESYFMFAFAGTLDKTLIKIVTGKEKKPSI
jgi:hypothetical protein